MSEATTAPEPDDIPDPVVPAAVTYPTLTPGEAAMLDMAKGCLRGIDTTLTIIENRLTKRLESLSPVEAGALEQVCQAVEHLMTQGVTTEAPNSVNLKVRTPAGFCAQLTFRRPTSAELFDTLTKSQEWLISQGYKPV